MRSNISSASPWEDVVGYSRAVRVGNLVFVSGTTSEGANAYEQTKAAIAKVAAALRDAGASLRDVVRTRMFVTNINDWESVGQAHREAFAEIKPTATMIEVSRLIAPSLLIEIEVDAVLAEV